MVVGSTHTTPLPTNNMEMHKFATILKGWGKYLVPPPPSIFFVDGAWHKVDTRLAQGQGWNSGQRAHCDFREYVFPTAILN